MIRHSPIIAKMDASSLQPSARPVNSTTAESDPGAGYHREASGNTAMSPGFYASRRSTSLIEERPGLENVSVSACRNNNMQPATRNAGSETCSIASTKLPPTAKSSSINPAIATDRRARLCRCLWWVPDVRPAKMTAVSIGPIVTNRGDEARQEARGNVHRNFRIDRSPRRSFVRLNRGYADAGRLRVGFGRVRPHRHQIQLAGHTYRGSILDADPPVRGSITE